MKIAVIGGGNMGRAISFGAISTGFIDPKFVRISDPSEDVHKIVKDFNPSIQLFKDSKEAIKGVDLIIVAVKPWLLKEVLEEISTDIDRNKQGLVSIVAGAKFEQISSYLGGALKKLSLYRVIPNTAVSLGIGTSFISSFNTRTEVTEMVFALFSSIGATFKTAEEDMWAVTALSSCGIAYAYKYLDAAIQGGVEMGIEEGMSRDIVIQTMIGALAMLKTNNTMPQTEIDKVTTPGGLTLKGLEAMEENGFTDAVIEGLLASK